jgi:hypothetical protein
MKRHITCAPSIAVVLVLAFAFVGLPSLSRAANPVGNGGDSGADDGSAQQDADADADADADVDAESNAPPEGIQPTTTPDNLGCAAYASRGHASGAFDPVGALGALGIVALAIARRRRAVHQRRSS